MNNEPVAWVNKDESGLSFKNHGGGWEPLYAHPVNPYQSITNTKIEPTVVSYTHPVKDLTDEEIADLIANKVTDSEMIKQALRKAQEK